MDPLALTSFTATSCIGRGVAATLATLRERRTGLAPCAFETVRLDTWVGEVAGVDEAPLPGTLREFECRNNRLAHLGLAQDGLAEAVQRAAGRYGRERVGVFLGTSTSGILETELAYRERDPVSGALPAHFRYRGAHNTFSLAAFAQQALQLSGPTVFPSVKPRRSRCSSVPGRAWTRMRCCCSGSANRATRTTCPPRIRKAVAHAPPCCRRCRPPPSPRRISNTSTFTVPAPRATMTPKPAP